MLRKDRVRKRIAREQETNIRSAHQNHQYQENATEIKEKESSIYKSSKTHTKAITRTARSLPFSSRKKRLVVGRLAERVGLSRSTILPSNVIPDDVKQKVEGFKNRDDISRQLLFNITETFGAFKEEHPDVKIGRSTFA